MSVVNYDNTGSASNAMANYARLYGITPSNRLPTENLPMSVLANMLSGNIERVLNPLAFGAVGDGVTDDTVALRAMFAQAQGCIIDGLNRTYRVTDIITVPTTDLVIRNATFDASTMPNVPGAVNSILRFNGTQGAAVPLTANCPKNTATITVGSTAGFTVDGYVWLTSTTDIFAPLWTGVPAAGVPYSQVAQVASIDSTTQLTLHADVLYNFTTAALATIAPMALASRLVVSDCAFIGKQSGTQAGLFFDKCVDVVVQNCTFDNIDYSGIVLYRSVNVDVIGCKFRKALGSGLSYGTSIINGCCGVRVTDSYAEDCRHAVTTGNAGIADLGVNLFIAVTGNTFLAMRDAGIDSHPATQYMIIDDNTVECARVTTGPMDGIIFQGTDVVISNNVVSGAYGKGIVVECFGGYGEFSATISGNRVSDGGTQPGGASYGIFVHNRTGDGVTPIGATTMRGIVIAGNIVGGNVNGSIQLFAEFGSITDVAISNNVVLPNTAARGIYFDARTGFNISNFAITGNVIGQVTGSTAGEGIFLRGATTPNILNGTVSGNRIAADRYPTRFQWTENVVITGNVSTFPGAPFQQDFVDTGSQNIVLDRRTSPIRTVTAATATIDAADQFIICNRAGTITLTLPGASTYPARELTIKTIQAQAVDSASSNVVPIDGTVAGTAILPAVDGAWAMLKSDGTNWIIVQA